MRPTQQIHECHHIIIVAVVSSAYNYTQVGVCKSQWQELVKCIKSLPTLGMHKRMRVVCLYNYVKKYSAHVECLKMIFAESENSLSCMPSSLISP